MNLRSSLPLLTLHPAKAALLARIRVLESQIARLEEEKADCQSRIEQYYRLFRLYLGDLLTQTVDLQMQLAIQRADRTSRRSDAEEARSWRDRFAQTNRAVEEAFAHPPADLDETAEQEIRRLYRQAVQLAHPDRHTNDPARMAQATVYMTRLNDAYQRRDLTTVRQLARELNEGRVFENETDTSLDLETLQQGFRRLTDRQTALQADLDQLRMQEAYRLMMEKTDLIAHFAALRTEMLRQIDHLHHQLQQRS